MVSISALASPQSLSRRSYSLTLGKPSPAHHSVLNTSRGFSPIATILQTRKVRKTINERGVKGRYNDHTEDHFAGADWWVSPVTSHGCGLKVRLISDQRKKNPHYHGLVHAPSSIILSLEAVQGPDPHHPEAGLQPFHQVLCHGNPEQMVHRRGLEQVSTKTSCCCIWSHCWWLQRAGQHPHRLGWWRGCWGQTMEAGRRP